MSAAMLPPNVHIDVRWRWGGIGRFSANVVPRISGGGAQLTGRSSPSSPHGSLEMAARFHRLARRGGVLFSPGFIPPMGWERRTVVTVHDLHYLDPTISDVLHERYFRWVVLPQLRRCRMVLTVSDHSAAAIRHVLASPRPEVVVVGCGVDAAVAPDLPRVVGEVPMLLFVGGDKQNKNLQAALRAAWSAQERVRFELVVVGEVAARTMAVAPPATRFVGEVSDAELAGLYARSAALLMPSLDEGFGLPALEAMVAGTPVIFGDRGALPQLVDARGWPVDPLDDESISAGIVTALREPIEISERERVALLERHQWSDVAQRVRDAIASTL